MNAERLPRFEQPERQLATDRELLTVSRMLLSNTALYVEHLEEHAEEALDVLAHDEAASDLLKRFYELASFQLPESMIDDRLFPDGEDTRPVEVLHAMETVFASWQRGSIVASQREPLREFSLWLLDTQRALVGSIDHEELRRLIERGIDRADKRLT